MEMRFYGTSFGLSYQTDFNSIGVSAMSGLQIETKIGKCTTTYVVSKPFGIGTNVAGIMGFSALCTDWFTFDGTKLTTLSNSIIQLEFSATLAKKIDIKLTVYDRNGHPSFSFEKIEVPAKGISTSPFRLRGRAKRVSTEYKITRPTKK